MAFFKRGICLVQKCVAVQRLSQVTFHVGQYNCESSKSEDREKVQKLLDDSHVTNPSDVEAEFPSDHEDQGINNQDYQNWKRDQSRHSYRPLVNPRETSIFLFPGQGSQFVGMASSLLQYSNVPKMFKVANSILGYDLLDICLNGPQEKLNRTVYCQPAMLVTSLAAVEKLRHEDPQAIESCVTAAGFSVGEFSALVFADALSFEDAVHVVKKRAEAMQRASEAVPSGMATVFTGPSNKLKLALMVARKYCSERLGIEYPVCHIANYLHPETKVVAGHNEALEFIEKNKSDFGIRRVKRLPVSGAFHTELMRPAVASVTHALTGVSINEPIVPVHSNVNSYKYKKAETIRKLLAKQITSPVKWEQILHVIYSREKDAEFPRTYELGPGTSLGSLLKLTNKTAFNSYKSVDV